MWENGLAVGGTHIAAGRVGLLLMKVKTMLEKFTEECLPWGGPHGTAQKNQTPFPKRIEERFFFLNSKLIKDSHVLSAVSVGRKVGLEGGKRSSKGLF